MNLDTFLNRSGSSKASTPGHKRRSAKKALLIEEDDDEQELKSITKDQIEGFVSYASSSETSGEGSDDSPHYYKFIERTRKLKITSSIDAISLDKSPVSRHSISSNDIEKMDEAAILNEIVQDLNRKYSDPETNMEQDQQDCPIKKYLIDQDQSFINQSTDDTESIDEQLHMFSHEPRDIKIYRSRDVRLSDAARMLKQDCNRQTAVILLITALIPILGTLAMIAFPSKVISLFNSFNAWFYSLSPQAGFFLYSSLFLIVVPLALPTLLLTILGGFIFSMKYGGLVGFVLAMMAILVGEPIATLITFMIGRYLLKDYIRKNVIKQVRLFEAIDRSFHRDGLKLAILLRIQPIIPWNILNYILSVTSCSVYDFMVGTFIGIIPGSCTFLYVGINLHSISEIAIGNRPLTVPSMIFLCFSAIATFIVIAIISRESKRQLAQMLRLQNNSNVEKYYRQVEVEEDAEGGVIIIS